MHSRYLKKHISAETALCAIETLKSPRNFPFSPFFPAFLSLSLLSLGRFYVPGNSLIRPSNCIAVAASATWDPRFIIQSLLFISSFSFSLSRGLLNLPFRSGFFKSRCINSSWSPAIAFSSCFYSLVLYPHALLPSLNETTDCDRV